VEAKDQSAIVAVAAVAGATSSRVDCSPDGGSTWPIAKDSTGAEFTGTVGGFTNGAEYRCRAFAANDRGVSDPSPVSDAFRPCGSILECNPAILPIGGTLLLILLLALLYVLARWYASRTKAYVSAQVDDFPAINLGRGPLVGFGFIRSSTNGPVQDVIVDRGPNADVRVRYQGGYKFEVRSGNGVIQTTAGRTIEVFDAENEAHAVVLRATSQPPRVAAPADDENYWRDAGRSPVASGLAPDQSWD
jgi:hypothetical protein